jgi:starch-binding outer membrane protein, SusD/RagB family
MKRSFRISAIITLLSAGLFSCNKYLDVKPEDQFVESAVYSTEKGFINHLNGIYQDMGQSELYGGNLTLTLVSVLGQEYNVSGNASHDWYQHANYTYTNTLTEPAIDAVWSNGYKAIMSANNLLENMTRYAGILRPSRDSIIRGEAYAIRAYLHFDMLRLYGPVYLLDSAAVSVPYVTHADINVRPLLAANNVIDSVLADLDRAERCLRNDPVIAGGPRRIPGEEEVDFFGQQRNGRLNYFAVKALKARVMLYRGNKIAALEEAKAVIQGAGPWFPWTTLKLVTGNGGFPDRTFSTEHLFDIYCPRLYNTYATNYSPSAADRSILAAHPTRLTTTFEGLEGDYRYNPNWIIPTGGNKTYRCFFKYADLDNKDSSELFRYRVPLLRLSEMYYIAAECESDPVAAFGYINTVRYNRGLTDLPATAVLETEIRKEYQKEFYGEGQLFFYYKRKNQVSVPRGGATSGNFTMSAKTYVVPLPKSESDYR